MTEFYKEELLLLDKNQVSPTTITEGLVIDGDLTPFRHRIELVNTGNQLQNNGVITLRIPPDGTFVRKEPILIDESAKDDYIIQAQLSQDRDQDGVFEEKGKLFRFTVGQPSLLDDENVGETLKITLIPLEYRTKETLDAERLPFRTPKDAFELRAINYNANKGINEPALLFTTGPTGSIQLPDAESLKQDWRPFAPKKSHELFREIIERQSLPGVAGGVFEDFFFDYEANQFVTNVIDIKAEAVGTTDRGIIIDPLSVTSADTEKDKLINVDLIKFKNNVILQGSPLGGTLPTEHGKFSSSYEHAKQRPEWSASIQYFDGITTPNTNRAEVRRTDPILQQVRFFRAISDNINVDPVGPSGSTAWEEDFTLVPDYNQFASYSFGEIVVQPEVNIDRFYKAIQDVPNNPEGLITFIPQPGGTSFWADTGITFPRGDQHELIDPNSSPGGRRRFFSYTPWTEDFQAMRATTLFGISDPNQEQLFGEAGYQGVVPDWNYIRANFDRVEADNRFEQVTFKDVIKLVTDNSQLDANDRYTGARYLINGPGTGLFNNQDNKIVEWNGRDFSTTENLSDWRFSNSPIDGDTILDQSRGVLMKFDSSSNQWEDLWNILNTPGAFNDGSVDLNDFFGLNGDSVKPSPLHICRDIKLVTGSTGVPGQAFELRFDWNPFQNTKNLSSRGAWWFMQFPYPKIRTFGRNIGDKYRPPFLDTNNLDRNSKATEGWNRGFDSEDLGRIQILHTKQKLSLIGSGLALIEGRRAVGFADMPMKSFAVDIFDRVWHGDYKMRRNGEYQLQRLSFGENALQQIHYNRIDELLEIFNIVLPFDFFLKEKEFTGIEFDWRFVKSFGVFYNGMYNNQGFYFGHQLPNVVLDYFSQFGQQIIPFVLRNLAPEEDDTSPDDIIINHATLAIDELHFEKQLYANSDDIHVPNARSELEHLTSEVDYINAKQRSKASRERKKFVQQAWFMTAHGDVRMRLGEKFVASGPRVPGGTQDLVVKEVKHIIDNDGYMIEFVGVRKFVFT